MAGIGAPLKHDWNGLYNDFISMNLDKEVFLKDYCKAKGLNYSYTSRNFAAIERDIENHRLNKTRRSMSLAAPKAADILRELLGSDDEKVRQRVAVDILDRAGLAPQVATTRITNIHAQNAQVVIPPLFAQVYQADAERMLDGAVLNISDGLEPGDAGEHTLSSLDTQISREELDPDRPRADRSWADVEASKLGPRKPRRSARVDAGAEDSVKPSNAKGRPAKLAE